MLCCCMCFVTISLFCAVSNICIIKNWCCIKNNISVLPVMFLSTMHMTLTPLTTSNYFNYFIIKHTSPP